MVSLEWECSSGLKCRPNGSAAATLLLLALRRLCCGGGWGEEEEKLFERCISLSSSSAFVFRSMSGRRVGSASMLLGSCYILTDGAETRNTGQENRSRTRPA